MKYNINFVITNAENVAEGYGITPDISNNLFEAGVNVISTGNHVWDKVEIIPYIAKNYNLLKPNNLNNQSAGQGFILYETKTNKKILVINLLCNLFMRKSDNLFESVKNIMNNYILKKNCDAIIIDIHGEAASEKQALANYLDGKVTAQKFISQFGSVENLLDNVDKLSGKIKQKVIDGRESATLSKRLATIVTDVPIEFDEKEMIVGQFNSVKLKKLFDELEFRNLSKKFFLKELCFF